MFKSDKRFLVALSFPGERREFVERVANELCQSIDRSRILYDGFHIAEFARTNLDTHLQALYHDHSELVVVFLCADYERKEWPGLEWRAIRDLIKKKHDSSIMPVRFDQTEIPGLFSIDGWIDATKMQPSAVAALIIERLETALPRQVVGPTMGAISALAATDLHPELVGGGRSETLESLRTGLDSQVISILEAVWDDIDRPFSQTEPGLLYDRFGKEAVLACLSIHRNPLLRCSPMETYSITTLGALVTQSGPLLEDLLIRYVVNIRNRHVASNYRLKQITSSEVRTDLKLTDEEAGMLYKLRGLLCPFFAGGSSNNRDTWTSNFPSDIHDIPKESDDVPAYVRRVVEVYNPSAPVAMSDAASGGCY